jgi:predicted ArsR family transcriptional regulator
VSSTASDFGCADPRSLLVGILVLAKPPLTPPDIIALGYALRLSATNIKSHLTRLSAEGVLIRTGSRRSQRYSLAGRGRLVERIAASLSEQPRGGVDR